MKQKRDGGENVSHGLQLQLQVFGTSASQTEGFLGRKQKMEGKQSLTLPEERGWGFMEGVYSILLCEKCKFETATFFFCIVFAAVLLASLLLLLSSYKAFYLFQLQVLLKIY